MKIYYAYSKSEDVSEHTFTDCLDCLPCEALYVKSFDCDPLTLITLVEQYAHQNPDLISVDLLGRVREWQDGILYWDYSIPMTVHPLKSEVIAEINEE